MVFQCSSCDRSYKDQYDLKDHFEVIHGNKVYQCSDCGRRDFNSRKSFRQHLRQHKKQNNLSEDAAASDQGAPLGGRESRDSEEQRKPAEYQCPHCDRGYQRKKRLKDHMDFVHSGRKVECTICGRDDFNSMEYFREHMNKHKKRPNEVLRRAAGPNIAALKAPVPDGSLVVVMSPSAVHSSKARPERTTCSRCSESFSSELECQRHLLRVHFSWSRPHRCRSCFESFSDASELSKHLEVRHSKGLVGCQRCTFACDSEDRLGKHLKDFHNVEQEVAH